jgi:16S rRNA (guanine527-N7)-methyltransferase
MFHVEQAWVEAFHEGAAELQIPLESQQTSQFERYLTELLAWNKKTNLTAITDEKEIAVKHFLDSLACSKALIPGSLLDIGTGAGFPGLPLKILNPSLEVTLLEPSHKRAAFLHHIIGTLGLKQAKVVIRRLEDISRDADHQDRYSNAITRALDLLSSLRLIRPLLKSTGRLILCRTERLGSLAEQSPFTIQEEIPYRLVSGMGQRILTVLVPA